MPPIWFWQLLLVSGLLLFVVSLWSVPRFPRESQLSVNAHLWAAFQLGHPSLFDLAECLQTVNLFLSAMCYTMEFLLLLLSCFKLLLGFHSTSIENILFKFSFGHFFLWHKLDCFRSFGPGISGWLTSLISLDWGLLRNWNLFPISVSISNPPSQSTSQKPSSKISPNQLIPPTRKEHKSQCLHSLRSLNWSTLNRFRTNEGCAGEACWAGQACWSCPLCAPEAGWSYGRAGTSQQICKILRGLYGHRLGSQVCSRGSSGCEDWPQGYQQSPGSEQSSFTFSCSPRPQLYTQLSF